MININKITKTNLSDLLCCPFSHQKLTFSGGQLISEDQQNVYRISEEGIPLFAETLLSNDSIKQQEHYDHVAASYVENLQYPHTQEYLQYMKETVVKVMGEDSLGVTAEICCGKGEVLSQFGDQVTAGVGIDISKEMLKEALLDPHQMETWAYMQGDATALPLCDGKFDTVIMLGGIHHVTDRDKLFSEVARILKPGGRFIFREPLDDFWLWRWLRAVIYRLAPALDHETERPLRYEETVPYLEKHGLNLQKWHSHGVFAFCLFMNSDVLVFNRLFRFIPKIKSITRAFIKFDDLILKIRSFKDSGLLIAAVAQKSKGDET